MTPISFIARPFLLHKNRSKVQTSILPLSEIRRAVILIDKAEDEYQKAIDKVAEFFRKKNIDAIILCPGKKDLSLWGKIKRSRRYPDPKDTVEDLLISLYSENKFEAEYEIVCSNSRFKIGRYNLGKDIFNIILTDPEDKSPKQWEVFDTVKDLLEKIN